MTDYKIDRHLNEAFVGVYLPIDDVLGFIRAHGIDVKDVPAPSTITIADGKVTLEVVQRGADGKETVVDLAVQREHVTVGQCAPWPLDDLR